jgi:hypothetical protein
VKPLVRRKSLAAVTEPVHESKPGNYRRTLLRPGPVARGVQASAALAGVVGICLMGRVDSCLGQSQGACPHAEIYQRATNEFAQALFYKPVEPKTADLAFSLAPLILQEVGGALEVHPSHEPRPERDGPLSLVLSPSKEERVPKAGEGAVQGLNAQLPSGSSHPDRFGTLIVSNGVAILDQSRPAIYWEIDTVQIKGRAFARLSYLWCYAGRPLESKPGQGLTTAASGPAEAALPLQGIRITLNSAGQPAIWEVLANSSKAKLFYVSQNLEAAARAEFGKPLPGRRYAAERSMEAAPDVVVARVIDDSPVASGPIVYLSAGTRAVSTLICRCMAAQAKKLLATSTYDLLPFSAASTNSLMMQGRAMLQQRAAFWPGDDADGRQLETCLRLPEALFSSRK